RGGDVAVPGRRAAHGAGIPGRVRAELGGAVADVGGAGNAVVGARGPGALHGVRRAGRRGPGALLLEVALAARGAADRVRVLEGVRSLRGAVPVSRGGDVAVPGRRAARRPVRLEIGDTMAGGVARRRERALSRGGATVGVREAAIGD